MKITKEEYILKYKQEDAPGWMAIDDSLSSVYKDNPPRHYAPPLHYVVGGEDPIDGTSIYDSNSQVFHHHIITYGMSELYYNEDAVGGEFSKWGFEFTFRVKPFSEDEGDPTWAINLMNNLARYVFNSGNWFEENHFIPTNGPIRLSSESEIDIVGLVFTIDPELGKINTPHGEVVFLQMVSITSKEVERLKLANTQDEVKKLVNELKKDNPLLITDLTRKG